jgi:hypothetical protein
MVLIGVKSFGIQPSELTIHQWQSISFFSPPNWHLKSSQLGPSCQIFDLQAHEFATYKGMVFRNTLHENHSGASGQIVPESSVPWQIVDGDENNVIAL